MNRLKTTLLLTCLTLLLVAMGRAIGGSGGMFFALVLAGGMNFAAFWYSDRMILRLYKAREVTAADHPRLHGTVRRLAERAGLPMPRVYVIPDASPNAFATGRSPRHAAVAATEGLLNLLDDRELEGVMAHELAHVKNRDTLISTLAATFAGAISMTAHWLQMSFLFGGQDREEGGNPFAGLILAMAAPLAAMLVQMGVSRSREYLADAAGAGIGGDPLPLASALTKLQTAVRERPMGEGATATAHLFIVSPLAGKDLRSLFATHPPVEERVRRLEALAGSGR